MASKRPPVRSAACSALVIAARNMDWQQVVLNGGNPCFHVCEDGLFCGRHELWDGHRVTYPGDEVIHEFTSFASMVSDAAKLDLGALIQSLPPDVNKKVSLHDLRRLADSYNSRLNVQNSDVIKT